MSVHGEPLPQRSSTADLSKANSIHAAFAARPGQDFASLVQPLPAQQETDTVGNPRPFLGLFLFLAFKQSVEI